MAITLDRNIYVSNTGSDITGAGTKNNPYATWQKAVSEIGEEVIESKINVVFLNSLTGNPALINLNIGANGQVCFMGQGEAEVLSGPHTATTVTGIGSTAQRLAGHQIACADFEAYVLRGLFIRFLNGPAKDRIYAVANNTATTIDINRTGTAPVSTNTFEVVKPSTTITMSQSFALNVNNLADHSNDYYHEFFTPVYSKVCFANLRLDFSGLPETTTCTLSGNAVEAGVKMAFCEILFSDAQLFACTFKNLGSGFQPLRFDEVLDLTNLTCKNLKLSRYSPGIVLNTDWIISLFGNIAYMADLVTWGILSLSWGCSPTISFAAFRGVSGVGGTLYLQNALLYENAIFGGDPIALLFTSKPLFNHVHFGPCTSCIGLQMGGVINIDDVSCDANVSGKAVSFGGLCGAVLSENLVDFVGVGGAYEFKAPSPSIVGATWPDTAGEGANDGLGAYIVFSASGS